MKGKMDKLATEETQRAFKEELGSLLREVARGAVARWSKQSKQSNGHLSYP